MTEGRRGKRKKKTDSKDEMEERKYKANTLMSIMGRKEKKEWNNRDSEEEEDRRSGRERIGQILGGKILAGNLNKELREKFLECNLAVRIGKSFFNKTMKKESMEGVENWSSLKNGMKTTKLRH